jgi:hypothetical protein
MRGEAPSARDAFGAGRALKAGVRSDLGGCLGKPFCCFASAARMGSAWTSRAVRTFFCCLDAMAGESSTCSIGRSGIEAEGEGRRGWWSA